MEQRYLTKSALDNFYYSLPIVPVIADSVGRSFYVSTSGSDASNGRSVDTPWLSIAKVNAQSFLPGDTINFKGAFTGTTSLIVPSSGNASGFITFRKWPGNTASIDNTAGYGMRASGKHHIVFNGLDGTAGTRNYYLYDCTYANITNATVKAAVADEGCIVVEASLATTSHHITISNITSDAQPGWTISIGSGITVQQDSIIMDNINCTNIAGGGAVQHHGIYLKNCTNFRIARSTVTNPYHGAIKLVQTAGKTVSGRISQNKLTGYGVGGSGAGLSLDAITGQLIIDNNHIADGLYNAGIYSLSRSDNIEVYNNTIARNYYGIELLTGSTGWKIKNNNIMQDNAWLASSYRSCIKLAAEADIANNTFSNNNYRHKNGAGVHAPIRRDAGDPITLAAWQALATDPNSVSVDPLFTTAYTNLHLQSGSTLRSAGTPISGIENDKDNTALDATPDIGCYQYV